MYGDGAFTAGVEAEAEVELELVLLLVLVLEVELDAGDELLLLDVVP